MMLEWLLQFLSIYTPVLLVFLVVKSPSSSADQAMHAHLSGGPSASLSFSHSHLALAFLAAFARFSPTFGVSRSYDVGIFLLAAMYSSAAAISTL